MPFFIIFIAVPFIEIMLFIAVGDSIGFFNTLFFAFATAIVGGWIVRYQGTEVLLHIKSALRQGALPLHDFFDGICLVAAGAMLITPGFLTDAIGFSLLIPLVRAGLRHVIARHTTWMTMNAGPNAHTQTHGSNGSSHTGGAPDIIDVEYEEISSKDKR